MIRVIEISGDVTNSEALYIKEQLITSMKEYLYSGVLKNPTGQLANSITGYVKDHFIYIYSDKAYANAIDQGRRPHIMWYLLGKTIPLKGIGYRRVTLKSITEGKWRHPGHPGYNYIAIAMEEVQKQFPRVGLRLKS